LLWLSIAGGEEGFMKSLLGCEMQFFAVRWRSLIIGLAIAALGWPARGRPGLCDIQYTRLL